jgi:tyrosyl-tRNA synthetase
VSSPSFAPVDEQLALIRRGTADMIVEAELRTKLERRRRLRVKLGLDPTAPDLHLGHTVVLHKLRDFQDLGHEIVIIIGDFTALIGDPTGRSETRKPLTREEIRANADTYRAQLGKVLDMARARVEFNSTWLSRLSFEDVIREAATLTVAQLLQREDFATRYERGRPITLHEFLYPIAQGYDSVALQADVELGGTDQTFNLLIGRDLQRAHGQEPQIALTVPLLEGLDGVQKMSKSLGNFVGITESPGAMYGKLMSVSDTAMWRYFELLTRLPEAAISELRGGHPIDAKMRLSRMITAQYHGEAAAAAAEAEFDRTVRRGETPDEVPRVEVHVADIVTPADTVNVGPGAVPLWRLLRAAGLVPSGSEARRMIQQGAVEVDGERVSEVHRAFVAGQTHTLRVGKRQFRRVTLT